MYQISLLSSTCGWDLAEFGDRSIDDLWMRSSRGGRTRRIRSSRMVRTSDSQCWSCNWPVLDPNIFRHSGIWVAAEKAVFNKVITTNQNDPLLWRHFSCIMFTPFLSRSRIHEHTISLGFLSIILRVLRIEVSLNNVTLQTSFKPFTRGEGEGRGSKILSWCDCE